MEIREARPEEVLPYYEDWNCDWLDVKELITGSGQILQCLQSHGQEVSDRCYQTFPKGKFFFK